MRYLASHEKKSRGRIDFPVEIYHLDHTHPRYEMPFHWHIECELIYVLSGQFTLMLDDYSVIIKENESVFIPSGVIHGGKTHDCIYECLVFSAEYFIEQQTYRYKEYEEALGHSISSISLFNEKSKTGMLISNLFCDMAERKNGYEFRVIGYIWQIIGEILIKSENEKPHVSNDRKQLSQIKNVLRRIRNDYSSTLTLQDLAMEAGLNHQYLCKAFRQLTGKTPIDYLNYYRIECASELLFDTKYSITEIAYSCGFNDLSYFIRLFKRYKKVSPKQYRKQL